MEVKILGMGCARCNNLERMVRDVLAECGIDVTVSNVSRPQEIFAYPVMAVPALVITTKSRPLAASQIKKRLLTGL